MTVESISSKSHIGDRFEPDVNESEEIGGQGPSTGKPPPPLAFDSRTGVSKSVAGRMKGRQDDFLDKDMKFKEALKNPVDERLLVADALYDHAMRILRRNKTGREQSSHINRFAKVSSSPSPNLRDPTKCIMTFVDIVQLITKFKRRRIALLLFDIKTIAPSFVSWDDPKASSGVKNQAEFSLSKDTTVWIETANFKSTRARLSFNSSAQSSEKPKSSVAAAGSKRSASEEPASTHRPVKSKLLRTLTNKAKKTGNLISAPTRPPSGETSLIRPPEKKQPKFLHRPPALKRDRHAWESSDEEIEAEFEGDDNDYEPNKRFSEPSRPPAQEKKWRHLRINPHLILWDEDYTGGSVIQPSFAAPRDLHRLFNKLSNNQRI